MTLCAAASGGRFAWTRRARRASGRLAARHASASAPSSAAPPVRTETIAPASAAAAAIRRPTRAPPRHARLPRGYPPAAPGPTIHVVITDDRDRDEQREGGEEGEPGDSRQVRSAHAAHAACPARDGWRIPVAVLIRLPLMPSAAVLPTRSRPEAHAEWAR